MPRLSHSRLPGCRKHKASGQAVVTLAGRDHYLGRFGSADSRAASERLTGEWLASGRRTMGNAAAAPPTVTMLLDGFWRHAKAYYRKQGQTTTQLLKVRAVVRRLKHT